MIFETIENSMVEETIREDVQDIPDCFGEFCKTDRMCTSYCAASIQCAVEHSLHPKVDLFDQLMHLNYFPARMQ